MPPLPLGPGISHRTVGEPPDSATFFNLAFPSPNEKNAMEWLSGDQNGNAAPSLPSIARAVVPSSARTHSRMLPSRSVPVNASCRPSGEMARRRAGRLFLVSLMETPGGGRIAVRYAGASTGLGQNTAAVVPTNASSTAGTAQTSSGIVLAEPAPGGSSGGPPCTASSISTRASPMACSRRRGILLEAATEQPANRGRHVRRQRSPPRFLPHHGGQ